MSKKVIVVFSGGQDSTTVLGQAIKDHGAENVVALSFFYGQNHALELEQAALIASKLEVYHEVIDMEWLGGLSKSALTSPNIEIPVFDENREEMYPPTFVPGRNHMFLSVAAIYAFHHGIDKIYTGVCQTDYSGYPDCRLSFVQALQDALNEAMAANFEIITPLMFLDKKQTWALADELGIYDLVREYTLTCYNGIPGDGCGECDSCTLRKRGLDEYLADKAK